MLKGTDTRGPSLWQRSVTPDRVAQRKLEERLLSLFAAQREVAKAQEDADEYAAKLLLSEYGLIVGERYTFKSESCPDGYHGTIMRAEGYFDADGVSLCIHVSNGYSTIRILGRSIPPSDGHA